ncbi:MAG: hypothetical protein JJE04_13675 [Acidobacteriia bacterium]|nr:hypothetical protein [Terriglobia bacterium]
MKKTLVLLALAGLTIGMTSYNSVQAAPGAKVTLCHVDPDELELPNPHVIEVSENAVPSHLDHGDYLIDAPRGTACELVAP